MNFTKGNWGLEKSNVLAQGKSGTIGRGSSPHLRAWDFTLLESLGLIRCHSMPPCPPLPHFVSLSLYLSLLSCPVRSPFSFFFFLLPFLERTKFPRWSLGKNMWREGSFHPVQFDVVLGGTAKGACDNQRGHGHVGWQMCRCLGSTVLIRKGKIAVEQLMKLTEALSTSFTH